MGGGLGAIIWDAEGGMGTTLMRGACSMGGMGARIARGQAHHRSHWRSGYDRNRREQCGPHWRCHLEYTQEPLVRRTSTFIFVFDSIKLIFQNS